MSRLARVLLLVGGIGVLAVLVRRVGASALLDMLQRVGWSFLWICGVYALHVSVRATALWRTMAPARIGYRAVLGTLWSGEAVEMLTFAGPALGEPAKAWLL